MCGNLFVRDVSPQPDPASVVEAAIRGSSSLQERGLDGGGIAIADGKFVNAEKFFGLFSAFFTTSRQRMLLAAAPHSIYIHNRYSTTGAAEDIGNYQPHLTNLLTDGYVSYGANGDIPDYWKHRRALEEAGVQFQSTNDGELTLLALCKFRLSGLSWLGAIRAFMDSMPGAYAGILMTKDETFAFRDPNGIRPSIMGTKGSLVMIASESVALSVSGFRYLKEIDPGEIVHINANGEIAYHPYHAVSPKKSNCIFEKVYFAHPGSRHYVNGRKFEEVKQLASYRAKLGRQLAIENSSDASIADICCSVPSSGDYIAKGYGRELGIKEYSILARHHHVGRTFIEPNQSARSNKVRQKFIVLEAPFHKYRRIVLLDDSIVRGTTMKELVTMIREAAAPHELEIHLRIGFPQVISPCDMGIAMSTTEELIASSQSIKQMEQYFGVQSLRYLSFEGLALVESKHGTGIQDCCTACFTGQYPLR